MANKHEMSNLIKSQVQNKTIMRCHISSTMMSVRMGYWKRSSGGSLTYFRHFGGCVTLLPEVELANIPSSAALLLWECISLLRLPLTKHRLGSSKNRNWCDTQKLVRE